MALIFLLAAAALSVEPTKLVLGKDAGAELTLRAPAGAKVTFSSSVGKVGDATRSGDVWTAHFTPPSLHSPSVALVLAQVDEGGDRDLYWLSIPLWGSDTMEIETRAGSKVEAMVAGERIGPVTADKNGVARLPMVVPPGVAKGTLRISDKLGNANEKPLDLEPPPFTRLRMAARDEAAAPGAAMELEIFVVHPDGTPDDDAKIEVSADAGQAEVHDRVAPGVYVMEYEAPEGKTGSASVAAKAEGQSATVEVPVRAEGAHRLWQSSLASQKRWSFSVGPIGGLGTTYDGQASGSILIEAALRLGSLPLEALVEVGYTSYEQSAQGAGTALAFASPTASFFQVGIRAERQMARGLDGHVALMFGGLDQSVDVRSTSAAASQSAWTPRLALAVGADLRLGPGRALAQVVVDTSGSGVAGLNGSVSGAQVQLGYLVTLH